MGYSSPGWLWQVEWHRPFILGCVLFNTFGYFQDPIKPWSTWSEFMVDPGFWGEGGSRIFLRFLPACMDPWCYQSMKIPYCKKETCYTICLVLKLLVWYYCIYQQTNFHRAACWSMRTNSSLCWVRTYKKQIFLHILISLRSDRRRGTANQLLEIKGRSESEGKGI